MADESTGHIASEHGKPLMAMNISPITKSLYTRIVDIKLQSHHQGYLFPSQVQKVAAPSSSFLLSPAALLRPPSSAPPHPFSPMTLSIDEILSCGLMIPSTSQSKLTFAISVLTSPGCNANTTVLSPRPSLFLSSSAARCLKP